MLYNLYALYQVIHYLFIPTAIFRTTWYSVNIEHLKLTLVKYYIQNIYLFIHPNGSSPLYINCII